MITPTLWRWLSPLRRMDKNALAWIFRGRIYMNPMHQAGLRAAIKDWVVYKTGDEPIESHDVLFDPYLPPHVYTTRWFWEKPA